MKSVYSTAPDYEAVNFIYLLLLLADASLDIICIVASSGSFEAFDIIRKDVCCYFCNNFYLYNTF